MNEKDVKYITITQLNKYLKYQFENDEHLAMVYLKGEISNFKAHTRGHYYFTLKDEGSRINAVMFASSASKLKFLPVDGMKVLVTGKVTVYEATGGYQIYVNNMLEDGVGNLYIAYEQLKKKLESEGLFSKEHKKKIPRMPRKIGIVTASTGAAIRDILTTIKRRFPTTETILFPALVQGRDAAVDIARKIEIANTYDIDTLIVGRGGGSIEDLWPFNEEIVARAIYHSRVPIISGVGHEVDFTIADFVADLRAPTPTAAAELAVVDRKTVVEYLMNARVRCYNALNVKIKKERTALENLTSSYILKKPSNIYEVKEQKLDMLLDRLNLGIKNITDQMRIRVFQCTNSYILNNPKMLIVSKCENFKNLYEKLNKEMSIKLEKEKTRFFKLENSYVLENPKILYQFQSQHLDKLIEKLSVLNPLNTLKRGYAIVKIDNKVVSDVKKIKKDSLLQIEVRDGLIDARVEKVRKNNGR